MEGKGKEIIRKGPWKEEEDEVVINHVNKYGARDWSSIRSKGLLQRTGKSCRLRWVNKLRPNLKNGCKFSAEEERVVIELQAHFGNKWARIATYLQGRTDNDVKNFWSSRQKRLARILQNSASPSSKSPHKIIPSTSEDQKKNNYCCSLMEEKSSSSSSLSNVIDNYDMIKMVPLLNHAPHIEQQLDQISFPQVPQPQQDTTVLLPGNQQLLPSFEDPFFFDVFGPMDDDYAPQLAAAVEQPFLKPPPMTCEDGSETPVNTDAFFDDFPTDMFDQIEQLPSPSHW
ncbi:hypothetical protein ACOSQ4_006077 [Xanthoceras sorbifolium]